VLTLASGLVLLLSGASQSFAPEALWETWPARRFVTTAAPCLRHAELAERLAALAAKHPGRLTLEGLGRSVEGREIQLVTLGHGPRRVMLWSQMHGDEPSATPALVDLADTLLDSDAAEPRLILERLTLLLVPMLNPDGAERYGRRNAQAIDINRDALRLTTPEGQLLKSLRERYQPELGFNLHDQDRRTTVGDTGVLATIALLAVAGDPQGTLTPGRARAKRVASAVARALAPFAPGGISRYDEDWSPRAFGDNLTAWGTPVVLIESGGLAPGRPLTDLTRLNYVALLTALHGLAADDLAGEDASLYEGLARNSESAFVDLLLEGGRILQPPGRDPYRADLAIDLLDDDPLIAACADPGSPGPSRIREVGDGHLLAAARRWDATGRLLVPAFAASVRGADARSWLSASVLDAVSRLGVARLRWHVAPAERPAALTVAERLSAPGRAAIEVVDLDTRAFALEISGPPAAVASPPTVASALEALTRGAWREAPASTTLAEQLAVLSGEASGGAPALRPDARACLLVLRPRDAARLDASSLEIEAALLDGREAPSPLAGAR
jgi:hypothetical protein